MSLIDESHHLQTFREAVRVLYSPNATLNDRRSADTWLRSLTRAPSSSSYPTLLTVLSNWDTWNENERFVAATQLFSVVTRAQPTTDHQEFASHLDTILAAYKYCLEDSNGHENPTAVTLSRIVAASLIRCPFIAPDLILSSFEDFLQRCQHRASTQLNQKSSHLLLLSSFPEIATLSTVSMHPDRRRALICTLQQSDAVASLVESLLPHHPQDCLRILYNWCTYLNCLPGRNRQLMPASLNFIFAAVHTQKTPCSSSTDESSCLAKDTILAMFNVITAFFNENGNDKEDLRESEGMVSLFASLMSQSITSSFLCLLSETDHGVDMSSSQFMPTPYQQQRHQQQQGEGVATSMMHTVSVLAAIIPAHCHCYRYLISSPSHNTTLQKRMEEFDGYANMLSSTLSRLLQCHCTYSVSRYFSSGLHLDQDEIMDTRLAILAIWDDWLSACSRDTNMSNNRITNTAITATTMGLQPETLARLLLTLVSCVELPLVTRTHGSIDHEQHQNQVLQYYTADARDLPDSIQTSRRETADTIKSTVKILGHTEAISLLLQEASYSIASQSLDETTWSLLEAILYALNLAVPKQLINVNSSQGASQSIDANLLEALIRVSHVCLHTRTRHISKLHGTALTLAAGLGPLIRSKIVLPDQDCLLLIKPSFMSMINSIVQLITQYDDLKLARNAATALDRLSAIREVAIFILHGVAPDIVHHLQAWYQRDVLILEQQKQHEEEEEVLYNHRIDPQWPSDISTADLVLRALSRFSIVCSAAANPTTVISACDTSRTDDSKEYVMLLLRQMLSYVKASRRCPLVAVHLASLAAVLHTLGEEMGNDMGNGSNYKVLHFVYDEILGHLASLDFFMGMQGCEPPQGRIDVCIAMCRCAQEGLNMILALYPTLSVDGSKIPDLSHVCTCLDNMLDWARQCVVLDKGDTTFLMSVLSHALHTISDMVTNIPFENCFHHAVGSVLRFAGVLSTSGHQDQSNTASAQAVVALLTALASILKKCPSTIIMNDHQYSTEGPFTFPTVLQCIQALLRACAYSVDRDVCEAACDLAFQTIDALHSLIIHNNSTSMHSFDIITESVVNFYLTAAGGGHPSYMISPIARHMHAVWTAGAVRDNVDATAILKMYCISGMMSTKQSSSSTWLNWSVDAITQAVSGLFSEENKRDEARFKRMFKVMCGGKKKGSDAQPPKTSMTAPLKR